MTEFIDKLAYIHIANRKILMTLSKNNDTYYIPGGKRNHGESDYQALTREVKEELSVDLVTNSIQQYGIFEAQAHGKPEGTIVRMICYTADHIGTLTSSSEIEALAWYTYNQRDIVGPVDQIIFDDLRDKDLID